MGDHTESLQVDFAPSDISFGQIAQLFWKSHNPCGRQFSRQYMSAIWYHDSDQQQTLLKQRDELQKSNGALTTPVEQFKTFYVAEDYHQKYRLQSYSEAMQKFETWYPDFADFNNSTSAARLNGLIRSGIGVAQNSILRIEADQYGFDQDELNRLIHG